MRLPVAHCHRYSGFAFTFSARSRLSAGDRSMSFIGHNHSASLNIVNSALRNPLFGGPLFNSDMDTAAENRLKRLLALRDRYGSIAALARALHRSPRDATLSQIITRAPDSKTGKPDKWAAFLPGRSRRPCRFPSAGWINPGLLHYRPASPPTNQTGRCTTIRRPPLSLAFAPRRPRFDKPCSRLLNPQSSRHPLSTRPRQRDKAHRAIFVASERSAASNGCQIISLDSYRWIRPKE